VHRVGGAKRVNESVSFTTDQLRKYVKFARTKDPVIPEEGKKVLVECYRLLRQNDMLGKNKTAYRITVSSIGAPSELVS
jgi:DNA replication licensing factor MCM6